MSPIRETSPDVPSSLGARVREAVSEAIGYWERRRIVYNAVLALGSVSPG